MTVGPGRPFESVAAFVRPVPTAIVGRVTTSAEDPGVAAAVAAVRSGDAVTLRELLTERADLAGGRLGGEYGARTLLHVLTDWPGHRPNVAQVVGVLVAAGAAVDAPFVGAHAETPLHWAASCDDVAAVDALLDAGANIDAPGGSVGDGSGTPLFTAVVFGQWVAARRLVERGAACGPWEAAALGLVDPLAARLDGAAVPSPAELNGWFWAACHGGQRGTAQLLLDRGAELNWVAPWDGLTALDTAVRSDATELAEWLRQLGALPADQLG